jgi:soluble lytic murein transglycosylase
MSAKKRSLLFLFCFVIGFLSLSANPFSTTIQGRLEHAIIKEKIHHAFEQYLPANFSNKSHVIADAVVKESLKYRMDPLLMTAVIARESRFNPLIIGPVGEIGLMQVRPSTGKWIAKIMGLPWRGASALKNPIYNISLGVAYLSYLKRRYSPKEGLRFLAAYNMGEAALLRFLAKKIEPKIYAMNVMEKYQTI